MSVKKKLLAATIGGLFASVAHAQSTVTLYGIADGDLRVDHTAIGSLKSAGSGGESGSRWGIRGVEDLGNSLKASFVFEQGIDLTDNSVPQGDVAATTSGNATNSTGGRLFSRTATVGLSYAPAGDFRIGRAYNPQYVLWSAIDVMGAGFVAGAQNYVALGVGTRFDNAVYYDSPKLYGFQVSAAYRFGESTTATPTAQKTGNNAGNGVITYAAGPILAGYSYLSQKNAADNNTTRSQVAGALYDFKIAKVDLLWSNVRNGTTTRVRSYGVGVAVPVQAFTIAGQVGRVDNRYNLNNSTLKNDDGTFFGAAVTYAFSRRTDVYTSWAKFKNKNNAVFRVQDASNFGLQTVGTATSNITAGFDPWSAQVGIRHRF